MPESSEIILLLRKMGHDMRVPLNTLISTSDMLVEGLYDPLTSKQARAAIRLQRNSRRLLAILDDFVTYIKADAGELNLTLKSFAPRAALTAWCGEVRAAAEAKGLVFQVTTAETVPASLVGDEAILSRIVQALLWNAVAYTAQGQIGITSDWTPGGEWLISVQDSGSGISDENKSHIFEPFWRGDERPQIPTAGAGLGLPLALALATLIKGQLVLKETSVQGSHFCVQIPLETAAPQ
ncbi:MAG TPA: HAMP domain-containing sensor histidine kinase [Phototrophicaceae bacterium]|nr:HAMP domain-containing sensor histidine kinase [Phototrophicaceae bacterium]